MCRKTLSIVIDINFDHARHLELYRTDLCEGLPAKDRGHNIIEHSARVKEGINDTSTP